MRTCNLCAPGIALCQNLDFNISKNIICSVSLFIYLFVYLYAYFIIILRNHLPLPSPPRLSTKFSLKLSHTLVLHYSNPSFFILCRRGWGEGGLQFEKLQYTKVKVF